MPLDTVEFHVGSEMTFLKLTQTVMLIIQQEQNPKPSLSLIFEPSSHMDYASVLSIIIQH